jgi:hypothetical protein
MKLQEELARWSETMTADEERQQSMLPQRPFSDVYSRGSPVAKRQKVFAGLRIIQSIQLDLT